MHLIHTDVSGIQIQHTFVALGTESEAITDVMEKKYDAKKKLANTVPIIINDMAKVLDEKFTPESLDIAVVTPKDGFRILSDDEVAAYLKKK